MSEPVATTSEVVVTGAQPLPNKPAREVKVYAPQISVVLKKAIVRTNVAGDVAVADRVRTADNALIDLTKFLGQGTGVTVRRTVRGPDSGMFSIRIPDQMASGQLESIYGLVEPMDMVEIRMARTPPGAGIMSLPIILRGFVSAVTRNEGIVGGKPQRYVTITGHDYSKILQIMRVIYLPTMIVGQDLLTAFSLFLNYDVNAENYSTAADFVEEVVNKVITPFLRRMQDATGSSNSPVQLLGVEAKAPADSSNVSPFGTQGWTGGAVYDLLATFGDVGPWQELFVEDRKDGPVLVFRPVPFKDVSGAFIIPEAGELATPVTTTLVEGADVLSLNATRTDANVGNYFWVEAPRYQLIPSAILQMDQDLLPHPSVTDYQNCDPKLYGTRLLTATSNQGGRYDGQPEAQMDAGDDAALQLNSLKRQVLIDSNKDNVVLETGVMQLKGNEAILAGNYVKIRRGNDFVASYYGHTVEHNYIIGGGFTTTVEFDRGTGFLERVQRQGQASAYLQEIGLGASK